MITTHDNDSWTIDLLRDLTTGEMYVALTKAVYSDVPDTIDASGARWQGDQACIGQRVSDIAGPLDAAEVAAIHAHPHDWDGDASFDLDAIAALIAQGNLVYEHELASS